VISRKRDRSITIDERIGIDRISRKSNLKRNEKIRAAKDLLTRFILKFEDFGEGVPSAESFSRDLEYYSVSYLTDILQATMSQVDNMAERALYLKGTHQKVLRESVAVARQLEHRANLV